MRPNRDMLYSLAVFDLDAGPVTITLPDPGTRFLSMQLVDQDHYAPEVVYGAGRHTLTRERVGTRYVAAGVPIVVDPSNPEDSKQVHGLQDAIEVEQPGGPGSWQVPDWDMADREKVRNALLVLGETVSDTRRMFGTRDEVDPVRHLIGIAVGWAGNPPSAAF